METKLPYRWKSVKVIFSEVHLKDARLTHEETEQLKDYKFDGKQVLSIGICQEFGRKKADALAFNLKDMTTGEITCEPVEQVFYRQHVIGRDKDALLMRWLVGRLGDVTLTEDEPNVVAADSGEDQQSVTELRCLNCGIVMDKKSNAKTCSPRCRKAHSRRKSC